MKVYSRYYSTIVVISLLCAVVKVQSTLCPGNSQPFTENRCAVIESSASTYEEAVSLCEERNDGELVTFTTNGQLSAIQGYVLALGDQVSDRYWVGYRYNGSSLEDSNGNPALGFVESEVDSNGLAAETGTCVVMYNVGNMALQRISCSSDIPYPVCIYTLTSPSVTMVTVNGTAVSGTETLPIGVNATIGCSFDNVDSNSVIQWTRDGNVILEGVVTSNDRSLSELTLAPFLQCGEYQCRVTNSDGRTGSATVQLFGDINNVLAPPTPVSSFASTAESRTTLRIQWMEPDRSYVVNPLLISYSLHYSTEQPLNYTSPNTQTVTGLRSDLNGMGLYLLTGLQPGTIYYMGMRAENEAGTSDDPPFTQVSNTYGNAPSSPPANLQLSRNEENNALLTTWDSVETTPPTGRVAFYRVQFRDNVHNNIITELLASPRFSAASIFNVRDAQGYEVRVATAVQTVRSPAEYDLSPYTEWEEVTAIAPTIPIFPTLQPVREDSTVVIVSTIVPIVVVSIIIVIAVIIISIYISTRRHRGKDYTDGGSPCKNCAQTNPAATDMEMLDKQQ